MSSIMRARSGLTGRFEDWEVIGGSSLKPKVAGPSMLGIGCPNRHAFLFTRSPTPPENPPTSTPPYPESGFVPCPIAAARGSQRQCRAMPGRLPFHDCWDLRANLDTDSRQAISLSVWHKAASVHDGQEV